MTSENGKPPKSNSKLYKTITGTIDKFVPKSLRPLWIHPAGPQTIFFWAPLFKWGLVLAGLNDMFQRPVEIISIPQSMSLALTGFIWSRYAVVIIPKNYNLLSVNMAVAIIHSYQCFRAINYQYNNPKT